MDQNNKSFFASFFSKKEVLASPTSFSTDAKPETSALMHDSAPPDPPRVGTA